MSATQFLLQTKLHATRLMSHLGQIDYRRGRGYMVTVERIDLTRTTGQNQRLRAIEAEICAHTGHHMEEVHEILLARRYGTQIIELGNGKTMERPAKRTSGMGRAEIEEYIDWVISIGIEYGVEFGQ